MKLIPALGFFFILWAVASWALYVIQFAYDMWLLPPAIALFELAFVAVSVHLSIKFYKTFDDE